MKLYEECIQRTEKALDGLAHIVVKPEYGWPDEGKNQLIFQDETAYELGGQGKPALSMTLFTDAEFDDSIEIYGNDLEKITGDCAFARLAIVSVEDETLGTGNTLYQNLCRVEYVRYHLNPEGYMMRISPKDQREGVRVSKAALASGLSFAKVGSAFLSAYHRIPCVKHVRLIFMTQESVPIEELTLIAQRSKEITTALDHLVKNVKMDCQTCGLKKICAEVQEMCAEEFKEEKESV